VTATTVESPRLVLSRRGGHPPLRGYVESNRTITERHQESAKGLETVHHVRVEFGQNRADALFDYNASAFTC
jgi:hypothetical protein